MICLDFSVVLTFFRITNSFLAMPQMETNQLIQHGLSFERDAFTHSHDKVSRWLGLHVFKNDRS